MKTVRKSSINWAQLLLSIGICLGAGAAGSLFTASEIPTWYASLQKPAWNPPNWVFGPVWTTLYVAMGVAAYRVWNMGIKKEPVRIALTAFGAQLVFNTLWSVIFFGLHSPAAALAEILMLWGLIAATIVLFYRLDRTAAVFLLPYIAWVSFAGVLNYTVWVLNP